jgi:hypothetical protein
MKEEEILVLKNIFGDVLPQHKNNPENYIINHDVYVSIILPHDIGFSDLAKFIIKNNLESYPKEEIVTLFLLERK